MKKILQKTFFVILIAVAICTPLHFFGQGGAVVLKTNVVSAAVDTNSAVTGLKGAAEGTGLISNTNPIELAGTIVKTLLGFLGIVFIVLLLYGGGMRMFSQGEAGKVKASTDIIKSAIIGVFIIFASYIITAFVLTKVSETVQNQSQSPQDFLGAFGCCQIIRSNPNPAIPFLYQLYPNYTESDCNNLCASDTTCAQTNWTIGDCPTP